MGLVVVVVDSTVSFFQEKAPITKNITKNLFNLILIRS
jgi:hypothetical protein